jgi:hypothetical protein
MARPRSRLKAAPTAAIDPKLLDFRNFLYITWKHLNLPDPTPVQYDIAYWLQHGGRRTITMAFRGVGKSWITSAYVCWRLLINPQDKILVVSASKTRADDFSTFTKRLIHEMPILEHLIPRNDQRDSNIAFDVAPAQASHAPSVKSVGITGQITGSRANVIIPDDVESANNSATQMQREKLGDTVKEFDAVLSPDGDIKYLGTPQTEESLYMELETRGYQIRIWPARIPAKIEQYGERIAPYITDLIRLGNTPLSPVDPLRFDDTDLMEREASYGRSGFALQFMLDTSLSDANRYPLKLADFIVMAVDKEKAPIKVVWASSPELIATNLPNVGFNGDRLYRPMWVSEQWSNYQGTVMAIDPSGRGGDELGYAVVSQLHGTLYVKACSGLTGGYTESNLKKLALIAMENKVTWIVIESNFGDGMFDQLLKPVLASIYPCSIDPDGFRSSTQKEKRMIDTLEPVLNQHRLVLDQRIVEEDSKGDTRDYQLLYQLTRLTKDRGAIKHDDRLDALSIAVSYWIESMARDVDKSVDSYKEDMLMKELTEFSQHVFGTPQKDLLWADTDF